LIDISDTIEKIRQQIKKLHDEDLRFDLVEKFGSVKDLGQDIINQEKKLRDTSIEDKDFEEKKKRFLIAEKIRQLGKNATYIDDFVRLLNEAPYTLPANYFEPETALTTTIEIPESSNQRYRTEQSELAFAVCFPGSITFRYGMPRKILCGDFSRNFQAELRSRHELTTSTEFQINGRNVYFVKTFRTMQTSTNQISVCPTCLSADRDERCDHTTRRMILRKHPSSYPIKVHAKISIQSNIEPKILPQPLNKIINKVSFLSELKIGTAYTGFTRTVGNTTTQIDYEPYIGYVTNTKGLSFSLNPINEKFLDFIISKDFLIRDLLINIVFEHLTEQLRIHSVPRYHVELFLSSFIQAFELDNIHSNFDLHKKLVQLKNGDWIETALNAIATEAALYSGRFTTTRDIQEQIFTNISKSSFSIDIFKNKIKKLIVNSLSQAIFLAGCTTSGSLYDDMDYSVNYEDDEPTEIILFDATNGGNGASELIFNYLTLPENEGGLSQDNEESLRPRYLDESLFEILLPCPQGTIDRIHYQNLGSLVQDSIMLKLLNHSINIENESPEIFSRVRQTGFRNIFPLGIGLRQLDDDEPLRTTEKTRELASICIHGCPDCISLGSKAKPDQFFEKYSISKYILDLYVKYNSEDLVVDLELIEKVPKILEKSGSAIIAKKINKVSDYDELDGKISDLIGKKVGEKYIKLSGKWYDCQLSESPSIEVFCMLGLA